MGRTAINGLLCSPTFCRIDNVSRDLSLDNENHPHENHGDQLLSFRIGTSARSWELGVQVLLCTQVFAHLSCCMSVKCVFNEMSKKLRELKSHVQRNRQVFDQPNMKLFCYP